MWGRTGDFYKPIPPPMEVAGRAQNGHNQHRIKHGKSKLAPLRCKRP